MYLEFWFVKVFVTYCNFPIFLIDYILSDIWNQYLICSNSVYWHLLTFIDDYPRKDLLYFENIGTICLSPFGLIRRPLRNRLLKRSSDLEIITISNITNVFQGI